MKFTVFLLTLLFINVFSEKIMTAPLPLCDSVTAKYKLNMTLDKYSYKEYEPVMAKFEFINLDYKPYNVLGLFGTSSDMANFRITDDLGNAWSGCKATHGDVIYIGQDLVQPGDTIVVSMVINDWGEIINPRGKFSTRHFGLWGYFPAGRKYKALYSSDRLKSNDVEFEVTPMDEQDKSVIKLDEATYGELPRDSAVSIALSQYPDNVLTEYLLAEDIPNKNAKIFYFESQNDVPNLTDDYESFFKKYPRTYYMYDVGFMLPYYAKLFWGKENYREVIDEVIKRNKNYQLTEFLNNGTIIDRIKTLLELYPQRHKR